MLNMGFAEDVETILAETPDDKQVALFSATMPAQIRRISKQYLHDPVEITVESKTATAANIRQRYLLVSYPQKIDALTRILEVENFEGMIVFVRTKNETETLAEKLRARGFAAAAINGDVPQTGPRADRQPAEERPSSTSSSPPTWPRAASTCERISHVVNYDIPTDTESYVHRIGRTGRAGRSGDAISFVTPRERYLLRHLEKANGVSRSSRCGLPSVEDVNSTRLARFDDQITQALEARSRIEGFREIIAHYVQEYDVPEVDVAAALAVVAQGEEPLLLSPEPPPAARPPRGDRPERGERGPRVARDGSPLATYRIAVGKRHRVEPRQIVGAIANEGGLGRQDFGAITIRPDFSLVELPAELSAETWDALRSTRISGKLIDLKKDDGPPVRSSSSSRPPGKKPRRKKG